MEARYTICVDWRHLTVKNETSFMYNEPEIFFIYLKPIIQVNQ